MATSKDLISKDTECVQQTEEVFESDLLDELLLSQKQAAHFLELALLALRDDPTIASKVRMTANDSQDQHLKTHGLVKEYQGTALHVIHTMLPLIETGIKKKKELLVKKGLDKVLEYVDDMVVKTEETIKEYYKIKEAVNIEITDIYNKNKEIQEREKQIAVEMKMENLKLKKGSEDLKELQASKEKKEEKMKKLKSKREDFIADSVHQYGAMDSFKEILTSCFATVGSIVRGAKVGEVIYERANKATLSRKDQASQQALNASEVTKKDIEKEQSEIAEHDRQMSKKKEELIESLVAMEKLAYENANLMNEESLKMAEKELGKVTAHFGKILLFWEEFSKKLSTLTKSNDTIKLFIEFITDPELAEDIDESVTHSKKVWTAFGVMCTNYVDKSKKQLPELYLFMSTPVNQITVEEFDKRKKELLECQKADIRALEKKIFRH